MSEGGGATFGGLVGGRITWGESHGPIGLQHLTQNKEKNEYDWAGSWGGEAFKKK